MSVEQPLVIAARTVLEGRHGFQYRLPEQHEVYEQLAEKVRQGLSGEMILVNGAPGCGVTYCLENLARSYPRQCMILHSHLYHRHVTLTDRVCDAISMLRESESYKEPPAWLIEYAKLTGLKFLIFDDLDKYVTCAKEIDRIMYEVSALVGRQGNFTAVISTRNMKLIRRFIKFNSPRQLDLWVDGIVAPNTLDAMGAFLRFAGVRKQLREAGGLVGWGLRGFKG
ncbi:hypothetical protein P4A93_00115 [Pseudomonas syringae pv. syringae]|uniref:hypothetical protein n=1 Tax=Pseudomonas syringae TaxID=317 RepID=UPI0023F908FA|nr:hypothetical protein [Pseudomonas syringae]MDF5890048.1 hypothetical protein [Pseudomonas syringae pv. syringae]